MSKFKVGETVKFITYSEDGYDGYTVTIIDVTEADYVVNVNVSGVEYNNPRKYTIDSIDRRFRHITPLEELL